MNLNFNSNGNLNFNCNNKTNQNYVRPVLAYLNKTMIENEKVNAARSAAIECQLFPVEETGGIALEDVFSAFHECVRGKRNTLDALAFEYDYERQCRELWEEYHRGSYRPSRYIVFVSSHPVLREIFGSCFRDRVTDTLLAQRLLPYLEAQFVDDNYSTRVDKGTLYGIKRVEQMVRECSEAYTRDCWIMKLDIQSFFMSLPKQQLYDDICRFLDAKYDRADLAIIKLLLSRIIFDRPERHCVRKSRSEKWQRLPRHKSLFHSDGTRGLPIGKVISQLLALFYLDELDHLLGEEWQVEYHGRYVDDMVLIHPEREHLLWVKEKVQQWLESKGLRLHPDKVSLQHYSKGVLFVGGMVKPGRKYLSNRTVGTMFTKLETFNRKARAYPDYVFRHACKFQGVMNSYFGLLGHFSEWNTSHRVISQIGSEWYQVMTIEKKRNRYKVLLKYDYRPQTIALRRLQKEMDYYFQ